MMYRDTNMVALWDFVIVPMKADKKTDKVVKMFRKNK